MHKWLENAIFYEIYPQSFYDTNGDGIGDLPGIIEKLDYINELGCNALWINPCFKSPFQDGGYDISDYYKIAERYGNNEDARRLFNEAHKRNIKVLLDLVPGHTSIEHSWFQESMKPCKNEFSGRYIWTEDPWEHFHGVPNIMGYLNGVCNRGTCAVNFYTTQPALNYGFANPDPMKKWQSPVDSKEARATKEAMWDIMDFWLSMGCDGFRIDMAHSMIKNDDKQRSETIKFWQEIRKRLDKKFPDAVIISEWGEPDKALKAGFHMDFLLHFGPSHYVDLFRENPYFAGKGDLAEFIEYYEKTAGTAGCAGVKGLICFPSSNHDMPRISRRLNTTQLKLAFAFLLSMPGTPFIYYGDEIGMRYLENLPSVEGGYERTGSRTPMQWDKTLNAGFSSARRDELYISIDPDENRPNVRAQEEDSSSLLNEIKKQIKARQTNSHLQSCQPIEFISRGAKGEPLVYQRGDMLIGINPLAKDCRVEISEKNSDYKTIYRLGNEVSVKEGVLHIPSESAAYLKNIMPG